MKRKDLFRHIYHLTGGMVIPVMYIFVSKPSILLITASLATISLAGEILRLTIPSFNEWLLTALPILVKEKERRGISGQTYMLFGALITIIFADKSIAIVAISFLAIGDPAAAIIGKLFGRHKILNNTKSIEGSMACLIGCIAVGGLLGTLAFGIPLWIAAVGAIAATLLELFNFHVDDNFLIPVATSLLMKVLIG